MPTSARAAARAAGDHPVLEVGARLGYAASGLLHLVLGWLTLQLAIGSGKGSADQTGAMDQLAGTATGTALLWVLLAGFVLLGLWQVTEVIVRRGSRATPAAKAVVHAALAFSAVTVLSGTSGSTDGTARSTTAALMSQPAGVWVVGLTGAGVVAVGVVHAVKGLQQRFLRDLREHPSRAVVRLARIGYLAKGVALVAVGVVVGLAAVDHDPDQAGGLDEALRALLEVPAGAALVVAIGLGFVCYGLYSFARARYARV